MNGSFLYAPQFFKPGKGFLLLPTPSGSLCLVYIYTRGSLEMSSCLCSLLADKLLNLNPSLRCEHQLISVPWHSFGRGALEWAMFEQSKMGKAVP